MKIDSSVIGMESAGSYRASTRTTKRFAIMDYRSENEKGKEGHENGLNLGKEEERETEPENISNHQERMKVTYLPERVKRTDNTVHDIRQMTVRYIFELLFAQRRGRLREWMDEQNQKWGVVDNLTQPDLTLGNVGKLSFVQESIYEEEQSMSFSTTGVVKTNDGRSIEFGISLQMTQSFTEYYREELELSAVQLCDPIVLNYDTDCAQLSDQTFVFDLDMDGEKDILHAPGAGSGFLALDRNGNGQIDDGSELFGAKSQNGFKDLAKYDEDHNGWIDENDSIFDKLRIWCPDETGGTQYSLRQKGVGAICLQHAATAYDLKNNPSDVKGRIRSTGIFLFENGTAGTIQQLDLAK